MACLDLAVCRPPKATATPLSRPSGPQPAWLVGRSDSIASAIAALSAGRAARLVRDQLARERAKLLRELGRRTEAHLAWQELAARRGPLAAIAYVELAKVLEHVERDFTAALDAVSSAERLVGRSAAVGSPLPSLQADLARRRTRLQRRSAPPGVNVRTSLRPAAAARDAPAQAIANGGGLKRSSQQPRRTSQRVTTSRGFVEGGH